jgi:GTP-binding protein
MKVHTRFLLSATSSAQFPPSDAPEVCFLGRSNVGKSSLINALLGEQAARVSSTPGRTRAINFFALTERAERQQPQILFADLPGYGYAKLSKSISAEWPKFIDPYLTDRPNLALCFCLVDASIPPQPNDGQLIQFLASIDRPLLVVGTKADRLSGNTRVTSVRALQSGLGIDHVQLCSAKTGAGISELWAAIQSAAQLT